jgi:hypothetical protein
MKIGNTVKQIVKNNIMYAIHFPVWELSDSVRNSVWRLLKEPVNISVNDSVDENVDYEYR